VTGLAVILEMVEEAMEDETEEREEGVWRLLEVEGRFLKGLRS
jgi:hypothetical protein